MTKDAMTNGTMTNGKLVHTKLKEAFPDAVIEVYDTRGDGNHLFVKILSLAFKDRSCIQCHQMVYMALDGFVGTKIHALSLETGLPLL